jgi:hypothetical protein
VSPIRARHITPTTYHDIPQQGAVDFPTCQLVVDPDLLLHDDPPLRLLIVISRTDFFLASGKIGLPEASGRAQSPVSIDSPEIMIINQVRSIKAFH